MKLIDSPNTGAPTGAAQVLQFPSGNAPWLARLPVGLFGICVGLFAFAGAWHRAALWLQEPSPVAWLEIVSHAIAYGAAALLALLSLLYLAKWLRHPQAAANEFNHPLGRTLVAMVPLSYLQAVVYFGRPGDGWALAVAQLALMAHAALSFRLLPFITTGAHQQVAITPALYLAPVAGALVGSMALMQIGYPGWAGFLLGVGLSGWALLELRVLNRLFEGPLPMPQRFTIGLEMAPAAIAVLAATVVWPQLPAEVVMVGLGLAMGPVATVMARYAWWSQAPFSAGFWTFVFPSSALVSGIIFAVHQGGWDSAIGGVALACLSALVGFLAYRTIVLLIKGRLLPP